MIILIEGASKPEKKYHHHWTDFMTKLIIIIEGAQKPEKNAHLPWSGRMSKLIIFIEGASKPQKKVSPSLNRLHVINDHPHWGSFKTKKKSIISIEQILWQKWSFSSMGLKKTSKTDHNPKKSISMTEQISCHSMSKMIIIIEDVQKHLKTP